MTNIKQQIQDISHEIQNLSTYSKEKSDKLGEVFTPPELINEMLNQLPREIWEDKTKTWFDPAAGHGNFHIQVLKRLFIHLQEHIPDETERLKHIVEKQLYFAEYQRISTQNIAELFSFGGLCEVNIYCGDTLAMPGDYFNPDTPNTVTKTNPIDMFNTMFETTTI